MKDFFKIMRPTLERSIYAEEAKEIVHWQIECSYNPEIIKYWGISGIVPHGEKYLVHWYKRMFPLTVEEMEKRFGPKNN